MNSKKRQVLAALLSKIQNVSIAWGDVEDTLKSLGAKLTAGIRGRLTIEINGSSQTIQRSSDEQTIKTGTRKKLRRFLLRVKVDIDD